MTIIDKVKHAIGADKNNVAHDSSLKTTAADGSNGSTGMSSTAGSHSGHGLGHHDKTAASHTTGGVDSFGGKTDHIGEWSMRAITFVEDTNEFIRLGPHWLWRRWYDICH